MKASCRWTLRRHKSDGSRLGFRGAFTYCRRCGKRYQCLATDFGPG